MDETTHDLLLALAGRVDDDMLSWARELVAVGEDAHAVELVTASVVADRTPIPEPLRASLAAAGRAARIEIDAAALPRTTGDEGTEHRFAAAPGGVPDVAALLRELPERQLHDCSVQLTWRVTPAGTAPGPLPHPVVLVEIEPGARPSDVLAYQLAVALERAGVIASVEVLTSGRMRSAYHKAALRDALPIRGEITESAGPEPWPSLPGESGLSGDALFHVEHEHEPHPLADEPLARQPAATQLPPLPRRAVSEKPSIAGAQPFADIPIAQIPIDEAPATSPTPEVSQGPAVGSTAASLLPRELRESNDEAGEPPAPTPLPLRPDSGSRRRKAPAQDDDQPAPRPAPRPTGGQRRLNVTALSRVRRPLVPVSDPEPEPGEIVAEAADETAPHPLADPPTFAEMKDPLRGPLSAPLLDPLLDPTINEDDPLGLGDSPVERPDAASGEEGWAREWATGSWALAPSEDREEPAEEVVEDDERPAARHRTYDEQPVEAEPADEREEAYPAADTQPERQPDLGLRPESIARLSDADRQLLARLQAELVNGRPRVSRRAGVANGHRTGPPDLAG